MTTDIVEPETPVSGGAQMHTDTASPGGKQLKRSRKDSMIAGVCGGIAEYFDIDSVLVRIAFVLFTLMGGSGIIVYILLWIVMPDDNTVQSTPQERMDSAMQEMKEKAHSAVGAFGRSQGEQKTTHWIPIALIGIGGYFLLRNVLIRLGFFDLFSFREIWPLILILIGIALYYRKR